MRVVRYHEHGGPDVLTVESAPIPEPGPGQARLRVEAVAASYVDTTMRAGTSPFGPGPLPGSPHGEVVGVVEAVGPGVADALVGRRLAALVATDAYADYVLADVEWAATVPQDVSPIDATVLAMAAPCAMLALSLGRLAPGGSVLVHAAAGSIGHLAVQLARILGAGTVVGTAGSAAKRQFILDLGADAGTGLDEDWAEVVRRAAPDGVHVAVDPVGGAISAATTGLLAPFGHHVVFGAAGGSLPDIAAAPLLGMRSVIGFGIRQWRAARPHEASAQLQALTRYLSDGRLRPVARPAIALDDPGRAHALLEDRTRTGRVILTP